jgi:hypothetical protein
VILLVAGALIVVPFALLFWESSVGMSRAIRRPAGAGTVSDEPPHSGARPARRAA